MRITLNNNQQVYFTSDTHYNHRNLCSGTSDWSPERRLRQFDTIDKMNDTIVNNINSVVGQDDILIHTGDWSFGGEDQVYKFRRRLNCKNIHFFMGNHDYDIDKFGDGNKLFTSVRDYGFLSITKPSVHSGGGRQPKATKHRFVLCHFPIASWNGMSKGVMHLHGHIHTPNSAKLGPGKMMDIGVDGHPEFRPYSLDEVLKLLENREIKGLLHHDFDYHG